MKQRLLSIVSALALFSLFVGCKSPNQAYVTLYAVGHSTDSAFSAYLDLVVQKKVNPSPLAGIAKDYNLFQLAYGQSLAIAEGNNKMVASPELLKQSADLINAIEKAKTK